jgi:hypothetical protein
MWGVSPLLLVFVLQAIAVAITINTTILSEPSSQLWWVESALVVFTGFQTLWSFFSLTLFITVILKVALQILT